MLEVHKYNNNECKVASDVPAVQSKENKRLPKKKKKKGGSRGLKEKNQSGGNIGSKCYVLS